MLSNIYIFKSNSYQNMTGIVANNAFAIRFEFYHAYHRCDLYFLILIKLCSVMVHLESDENIQIYSNPRH